MTDIKQAVIVSFLGTTQDCFSEFQKNATTIEKLEFVSRIDGFTGVEMDFPYETCDQVEIQKWMDELGLGFATINVNIKKEAEWISGALSSPDKAIRDRAGKITEQGKDYAKAVGAPQVTCCPLSDGYDLLFQINYKTAWNKMVETIGETAGYLPEFLLFIGHKYTETRVHCQLGTTANGLLLLKDVQCKNRGITIHTGHSFLNQENPEMVHSLIYECGFDPNIHTNDNDTKADRDLIGASRHFLHFVELMSWAHEYGNDKFFTTDASPRIFDAIEFFNMHSEITTGAYNLAKSLNIEQIIEMMQTEDFNGLMKMVNKQIYRL